MIAASFLCLISLPALHNESTSYSLTWLMFKFDYNITENEHATIFFFFLF